MEYSNVIQEGGTPDIAIDPARVDRLMARHRELWATPGSGMRLTTFGCSEAPGTDLREVWNDPAAAMAFSLARLRRVLEYEDDTIPMVRVECGTGLMASAFGAEIGVTETQWPFVKTHPIPTRDRLALMRYSDLNRAGAFPKALRFIRYYRENLPPHVRISQCDLQGPWNTAHLLAGDKLFTDVYDDPDFVAELLDAVTDAMIDAVPRMKEAVGEPDDCFFLQGTCTPGGSRLCNCSTEMISPDFYEEIVLPRDNRFFELFAGMMHICGNHPQCIPHFNMIERLRGLEINFNYLDLFEVSEILRDDIILWCTGPVEPPLLTPLGRRTIGRFAAGEFPAGRNIFFNFDDPADAERAAYLKEITR